MLRRKVKKIQNPDSRTNIEDLEDKSNFPNQHDDSQDICESLTAEELDEKPVTSSRSENKVLNYLGAKIISSNNRKRVIRGIRTKAELLNLNTQPDPIHDSSHDKSDAKLMSENNDVIDSPIQYQNIEITSPQKVPELPILYPEITVNSRISIGEYNEHSNNQETSRKMSPINLYKIECNVPLVESKSDAQKVICEETKNSRNSLDHESKNMPSLPKKASEDMEICEDAIVNNIPPVPTNLSSDNHGINAEIQHHKQNIKPEKVDESVFTNPKTSNLNFNPKKTPETAYSSFNIKNKSQNSVDLKDLPNLDDTSVDAPKNLPPIHRETVISEFLKNTGEKPQTPDNMSYKLATKPKTTLIDKYVDYELDDNIDTEDLDINLNKNEVLDMPDISPISNISHIKSDGSNKINSPITNKPINKNDHLKIDLGVLPVDSNKMKLNHPEDSRDKYTNNLDFPSHFNMENMDHFQHIRSDKTLNDDVFSRVKVYNPIPSSQIPTIDISNVNQFNHTQTQHASNLHSENIANKPEQFNADKSIQDVANNIDRMSIGKDPQAHQFHSRTISQNQNFIPNQCYAPESNPNILPLPTFQNTNFIPPQNHYPFPPPMNYQYYNSSNFFPYQYMGPFVPPLIYTHPHETCKSPFPQNPYFYPPQITPYPNSDQYITNAKVHQNIGETPPLEAYLQWQEEYAKWYRTYHESNRNNSSRRNSVYSNRSFIPPVKLDNSNFFNDQRSIDDQRSVNDISFTAPITIKETKGRATPVLYSTQRAFCNFNALNKAVTFFEKSIDIYSITTKIDCQLFEFPGPLDSGDSTKRNLIKYLKWCLANLESIDPTHKLLWNIFLVIIQSNGSPDFCDLAEILLNYNAKLISSKIFDQKTSNYLSEQDHNSVVLSLISNDRSAAVSKAIQNNNWGLVFAICLNDQAALSDVLTKYIGNFDNHDLIRSYLSLQSNIVIDISTLKNFEVVNSWNQHVALFLSQYPKHKDACGVYINNIAKILQSKGRWEEYYICVIILDLIFGITPTSPPFVCLEQILRKDSLNLTYQDIIRIRTIEIYEYLSKMKGSKCNFVYLQMLKLSIAEIMSFSDAKEKAYQYLHSISTSILASNVVDYTHAFLSKVLKLSKDLFGVIFQSNKYPEWLTTLNSLDINELGNPVLNSLSNVLPIPENRGLNHKIEVGSDRNIHYDFKVTSEKGEISTATADVKFTEKCVVEEKIITNPNLPDPNVSDSIADTFNNAFVPFVRAQDYPTVQPLPIMVTANTSCFKPMNIEPTMTFLNAKEKDIDKSKESTVESTSPPETGQKNTSQTNTTETTKHNDKSIDGGQNRFLSGAKGLLGKIFKPRDGAFLPDDSDPQIVFDPVLNRYVDKSNPVESQPNLVSSPPKSIPSLIKESSQTNSRIGKNRYVSPTY